jgi:drug/metabolite transporter (DMT)-like permease
MRLGLTIVFLVLFAALLHAGWNALAKSALARPIAFALIALACGICGALVAPFVPVPPSGAWPWLIASVVLHNLYFAALLAAYGVGDLSLVYPIVVGETPAPIGIFGIGLASLGIVALSWPTASGPQPPARLAAIAWSVLIAGLIILYTVVDGVGTRASLANGSGALGYVSWMFILETPPFLLGVAAWYARTGWPRATGRALLLGSGAGVLAYASYAIVLYGLGLAPMAYVSALRESSVVFAALLGTLVLGEPFGKQRVLAAGGVAFGLALVTLAR